MNITANELRRAAAIQDRIEELKNELSRIFDEGIGNARSRSGRKGRRKMSAAARAKIAAAAKARWKKAKAAGKKRL